MKHTMILFTCLLTGMCYRANAQDANGCANITAMLNSAQQNFSDIKVKQVQDNSWAEGAMSTSEIYYSTTKGWNNDRTVSADIKYFKFNQTGFEPIESWQHTTATELYDFNSAYTLYKKWYSQISGCNAVLADGSSISLTAPMVTGSPNSKGSALITTAFNPTAKLDLDLQIVSQEEVAGAETHTYRVSVVAINRLKQ